MYLCVSLCASVFWALMHNRPQKHIFQCNQLESIVAIELINNRSRDTVRKVRQQKAVGTEASRPDQAEPNKSIHPISQLVHQTGDWVQEPTIVRWVD